MLKFQGDVEDGTEASEADRERVLEAWRRTDPAVFYAFNAFLRCECVALGARDHGPGAPAGLFASESYVATFMAWLLAQTRAVGRPVSGEAVRYRRLRYGDAPYGDLHHCWVFMMALGSVADDLLRRGAGYVLRGLRTAGPRREMERTAASSTAPSSS